MKGIERMERFYRRTRSSKKKNQDKKVYRNFFKYSLDIFFSLIMLIILFIPMLFISFFIKVDSKGPVFFKQIRFGLNSKPFIIYKFRSMVINAPVKANQDFDDIKSHLTKVGFFIRKFSIDEWPQLWNVLKGDMSIIGPRALADTDRIVLNLRKQNGADKVRPGITGLAQIHGRNNITDQKKAFFDAEYAENLSAINDLKIIFKTIVLVLGRKGIFKDGQ
ncbi:Uncharacterized sugar transferase EpsL [Oenococcus oeni]|uniref:Uncharacterized sugar transferase EpsL n=1 Tax=Oenococcus oeni TaxID=1247 RepID=A0AAQ2UTW5_OENOE|nr:sugar transferase [Oenococcus oeni]SYW04000.1 Uncharacterized sugar transferase EpsL [Oenococcus oeni]VDB98857.1 Uncharacterized sugar transferase EpsL [Oenococcus oeni]